MKKTIGLLILSLVASSRCTLAADPVEDFVRDLVTRVDEQYWWGATEDKPAGGYLFKFEYDITGDGKDEIFIASSLEEDEGVYHWGIYSRDARRIFTKIVSGLAMPPVHGFYFKINEDQRELQTVYRNFKFSIGLIERYTVDSNGKVTHTTQELTPEQIGQLDTDSWMKTFGIGIEVKPGISKVLLAEYVKNRTGNWRVYDTDLGVAEQNRDPADASAIAESSGFTLQDAKRLLGVP